MANYVLYGVLALTLLFNITLNFRVNMMALRLESLENERDLRKYKTLSEATRKQYEKHEKEKRK